jgi:hypothetical protein
MKRTYKGLLHYQRYTNQLKNFHPVKNPLIYRKTKVPNKTKIVQATTVPTDHLLNQRPLLNASCVNTLLDSDDRDVNFQRGKVSPEKQVALAMLVMARRCRIQSVRLQSRAACCS